MGAVRTGRAWALMLPFIILSCGEAEQSQPDKPAQAVAPGGQSTPARPPIASLPRSLPDDDAPASERPVASDSAQGAATILETYYALIEARKYREAWLLRESGPAAPGAEAFARNFEQHREYHAKVGAPSEVVAAGGSFYVEVPVHTYGMMKNGRSFSSAGTVTLRRARAGSKARQWRIYTSG